MPQLTYGQRCFLTSTLSYSHNGYFAGATALGTPAPPSSLPASPTTSQHLMVNTCNSRGPSEPSSSIVAIYIDWLVLLLYQLLSFWTSPLGNGRLRPYFRLLPPLLIWGWSCASAFHWTGLAEGIASIDWICLTGSCGHWFERPGKLSPRLAGSGLVWGLGWFLMKI